MIIKCKNCGFENELSEALKNQLEDQVLTAERLKHQSELEKIRKEAEEKAIKKIQQDNEQLIANIRAEATEEKERNQKFQVQILELTKELREAGRKVEDIKMEAERKRMADEEKVRSEVLKKADDDHRLKDLEKEKVINDLRKALDDAQRKAGQGSQQLQGEVLELELEELLRQSFPSDLIEPVEKGIRGADIKQTVKTTKGSFCGIILWESKRTKAWSNEWLSKLKEDLRTSKANAAILVTAVMPKEIANKLGFIDGVWVTDPSYVREIADLIRQKLIEVARERFIAKNKDTKAEAIYNYCTSQEFANQVLAIYETNQEMLVQINKEKAVFEKLWKAREAQCSRILKSTASVIGEMQGLVGQGSMPQFKELDILSLEPENK